MSRTKETCMHDRHCRLSLKWADPGCQAIPLLVGTLERLRAALGGQPVSARAVHVANMD